MRNQADIADILEAQPSRVTVQLALALAIADTIASAAFLTGVGVTVGYGAAVALKILVLFFAGAVRGPDVKPRIFLVWLMAMAVIAMSIINSESLNLIIQRLGYFISISLSLFLLTRTMASAYFRAISWCVIAYALIFLAMFAAGRLNVIGSRVSYFGGTHPNLAGEVMMMGVFCATLYLRPALVLMSASSALCVVMLTQSRASLLVIVVLMALWSVRFVLSLPSKRQRQTGWLVMTIAAILLLPSALTYISSALLLDDAYRGLATGLAGRDERWLLGWSYFASNPFTGVGLAPFETGRLEKPHNFFLYALAGMGIAGAVLIAIFLARHAVIFAWNRWIGLSLAVLLITVLLNDRFLDLNVYPFVYQLALFAFPFHAVGKANVPVVKTDGEPLLDVSWPTR